MTECPLDPQACFPSVGKESVTGEYASRSVRGDPSVLDHLLVLLPSYLNSQPTSHVFPFPPSLLFSICDALQHGRAADGPAEQNDASVLPSVLSKLRDWRVLDAGYRYSPAGVYKLALDLAMITDEPSPSTSPDFNCTSHARLRMKWISSDSHGESQDQESSSSTPPSASPPQSAALVSSQECAHALPGLNERCFDAGYESCQVGKLGTPDSEDASPVVSRRHHSISGFRSGCSACRHPRVSGPSTPPSPRQTASWQKRTPFSQFDTNISTTVASPRYPEPSVQHPTTKKKTKRVKHPSLPSVSRGLHADENEPSFATPIGVQRGIGISFPRQRTHYPRISNALLSREPSSPAAASVQRRAEPSHLLNRTREGDKHTTSHRTVASVDLRLPMSMTHHSPNHASPIDLHPCPPTRAQSFSYTQVRSHTSLGSVVVRVQKLSSNAVGSRSSKRLPSWSHQPPTTTSVTPTSPVSTPPAKASDENPHPCTRLRPSSPLSPLPRVPSVMKRRDRRSVSSQTHKHTQSAGALPSSPLFYARQWQV